MSTDHIATPWGPVEEPGSDKRFRIPNARGNSEPQSRTHDDKNTIDDSGESSVSSNQVTGEEPTSIENGTKYFPEVLPGQDADINKPRATDSEVVQADDEFTEQIPRKEKNWKRRIALGAVAFLAAGGVATGIAVSNSHGTPGQGIPHVTAPLNPNQQPEAPKGDSRFDQIITKTEAEQKLIREQLVTLTPNQVRALPRAQQARWQMYWRHEMQHEAGFTSGLGEDVLKPENTQVLAELVVHAHYKNMLRIMSVMADTPMEGFNPNTFERDIMALCGPDFSKKAAEQLKALGAEAHSLEGVDRRIAEEFGAMQLKKLAKDPRTEAILTKQTNGSYLLVVPVVQLPPDTQYQGLAPTEVPEGAQKGTMRFWLGKTPNSINTTNSAEAPLASGEKSLVDFLVLDAPENIK